MLSPESNPPIKPRKIIRWICVLPSSPPTISHKRRAPLFFALLFFWAKIWASEVSITHLERGPGAGMMVAVLDSPCSEKDNICSNLKA